MHANHRRHGRLRKARRRVARLLADAGVPLRLLVRNPAAAPELPDATVHVAPYADGDAVTEALAGVGTVFMVSAAESEDRAAEHEQFVAASANAGVGHVVYTSFLGAGPEGEGRCATYTAIAAGELDVVSGDIEAVTGNAPMDFRAFLRSR